MQGVTPHPTTQAGTEIDTKPDLLTVTTYVVRKGDTASEIAQTVASPETPWEQQLALMREINDCDLNKLKIGQRICIPAKEQPILVNYQVRPGDTLEALAAKFNATVGLLQAVNNLGDTVDLTPGQYLKVIDKSPRSIVDEEPLPLATSNTPAKERTTTVNIEEFVAGLKSNFGGLCRSFESAGKSNAYSNAKADPGGASWGSYQIAEGTMPLFITYLKGAEKNPDLTAEQKKVAAKAHGALLDKEPDSSGFKKEWNYIAKTDPRDFKALQHSFILDTHLTPVLKVAHKLGFEITPQTAEVFLSIGVQHGKFEGILQDAARSRNPATATTEQQIEALYDSRREYVEQIKEAELENIAESKKLSKSAKQTFAAKAERLWNSVLNRYTREERQAKALVENGNG
jgi:LysM repeat protein